MTVGELIEKLHGIPLSYNVEVEVTTTHVTEAGTGMDSEDNHDIDSVFDMDGKVVITLDRMAL